MIDAAELQGFPGAAQQFDAVRDIRVFSKCRNERLRLPAFLKHYRNLGADRFFIVDNASTDGSFEYLQAQPDVHVFSTSGSFRAAHGGTDWLNIVLRRFGPGRWCVTVDVDELLYYPGSERTGLPAFTAYLEQQGAEALYCQLLDMYPQGSLGDSGYAPGDDLPAAAPYFDRGPYEHQPHSQCPGVLTYGGVRERVFFPESWNRGWTRWLHVAFYHRLLPRLPVIRDSRLLLARRPVFPPCLTKVPLVKWDSTTEYLNVNHFVSPRRVATESGVLLHFKLLQDFHSRAASEVKRAEYYDGAIEFRRYAQQLRDNPRSTFVYEGSERFVDSAQLVELNLMRDSAAWADRRLEVATGA